MARTFRIDDTRDGDSALATARRPYYSTERKPARKLTNRRTRHEANAMLASGVDHDDAAYPRHAATSGWMTH